MILDDNTLIEKTDRLVKAEKELLTTLLKHFAEIERRRLFSSLGHTSLWDMIVHRYGFSEDEASVRVAACRLLSDLPELEEKISAGEISMTHMRITQRMFRQEEKAKNEIPKEKKLEIIDEIAAKPTREAQKITDSYSSVKKEQIEKYVFAANEATSPSSRSYYSEGKRRLRSRRKPKTPLQILQPAGSNQRFRPSEDGRIFVSQQNGSHPGTEAREQRAEAFKR